ncbi:MAG: hypothetical protein K6A31_05530 [Fibrobacter sp.]|nr:hypothetical protein [Fibrobacter sp.]
MKNGAIVYVFSLFLVLSFWAGCASHSETVMVQMSDVQPTVIVKKMGIPFSIDSVAENSELRHVFVWDSIALPSLADLDFAAYYQNPIREAGKQELPENAKPLTAEFGAYPFPMFDSLVAVEPEFMQIRNPVAWEPFTKILYAQGAGDSLAQVFRSVESVKWGQSNVFADFQKIEKLYLFGVNKQYGAWWVQVVPRKWTGKPAFWARLKQKPSQAEIDVFKRYTSQSLNLEMALDWVKTLAAYWYPTFNTDMEVHEVGKEWNGAKPFAVMRGNPMGTPMWVAFDVPQFRKAALKAADTATAEKDFTRVLDTNSAWRKQELEKLQGVCPETPETEAFKAKLAKVLDSLPAAQNAWSANGMLWFRRDANSLLAKDFTAQDSLHNPLPRLLELKAYLDSLDIQFLVVPMPTKEALYADKMISGTADTLCVDVASRDIIRKLLAAGVDVLDVFPALRAARAGDDAEHFSFQKFDTHWAMPGLLAAMEQLAMKVTTYAWYENSGAAPGTLEMRDTTILREGDLIQQLPHTEQGGFAPETLDVKKIYKDGKPYVGGKDAPILLMGDSFTGVFESVDGKSGGPGSLLAFATGLDVQVVTSWGGGPLVRHRMVKDKKSLKTKRLVIYMMTLRDFWQSPLEWDVL